MLHTADVRMIRSVSQRESLTQCRVHSSRATLYFCKGLIFGFMARTFYHFQYPDLSQPPLLTLLPFFPLEHSAQSSGFSNSDNSLFKDLKADLLLG